MNTKKKKKYIAFILLAAMLFVLLGVLYARYITALLSSESQMHLSEVAVQGAASVQRQIARDFDLLEILADGSISDPEIPLKEKLERIKKQADKFGLFRIGIVDPEGNTTTSDGHEFSVADREFFKAAIKGERYLSQPIIDKVDKVTPGIVYSVPVYNNDKVVSVLFSGYELDKLTERIDISFYHESGLAFIVNSDGEVLLHPLEQRIGKNIVDIAGSLNNALEVQQFKSALESGKSGVSHFLMNDDDRFFAYAPIIGANDWFLVTSLPATVVFERSQKVIWLTVFLLFGVLVLLALIALYIIISKSKANAEIVKLAYYDVLTKAANTERFKLDTEALFHQFGVQSYTLINFDVKEFRYLNNDLGRSSGNELLMHIAYCLKVFISENEAYARVGSDQFLLLLHQQDDEKVQDAIERLRASISAWQPKSGGYYSVQLAFGIYKMTSENSDIMSAIEKSNIARKTVKNNGESIVMLYDADMQLRIDKEAELEKAMPTALANGEFKLYIQPKYDLISEKIVGGEALVRWLRPDGTMLMPDEFIPLFERSGAIYDMDLYMLQQLCKLLHPLLDKGLVCVPISINQSRRYMYSPSYTDVILATLREYAIATSFIELEITENLVYTDLDKLIRVLDVLHNEGFRISLDDFGSGYSSLNVLKDLPVDIIKLDRFMLGETLNSKRAKAVVSNIIRMAKELEMSVVAEGVETQEQVNFLRGCGCETAQGYYYSAPLPAQQFLQLLR